MKISENVTGALLMMGAMTAFTVNDAFMKGLSSSMPLFQALLLRSLCVIVAMTLLCRVMGQLRFDLPRRDWMIIAIRSLSEVGGAYFFLTALFNMPIANVSAILQVLPLTVSLGGALFLREPLGWRRLLAIVIGFCGVMLIVRPGGADFNGYAIMAVAAVLCVTVRDLSVRFLSPGVPSLMVSWGAVVGVLLFSAVGALFVEWQPITGLARVQVIGTATFVIFGYICSVAAMRVGQISFVAPFRYTSLLVAIVLGVLFFNEFPDTVTLVGAALVVATGLFTLWREARLRIERPVLPDRLR